MIQTTLLGDQVYELLWLQIISGELRQGEKLSDLEISQQVGVSRTPVRDALRRLVQDGIVQAKSRRGFFVATFSSDDVREIYDIRTALEQLAVRLALPHLETTEIDDAEEALAEMRRQVAHEDAGANERFLVVDRDFHALLVRKARSKRLSGMMASIRGQVSVFQVYGIHSPELLALSLDHHQAILTALKQRDSATAEAAMRRHIQEVKEHVLLRISKLEAELVTSG